ncbi:hypothetical protein WCU81_16540 [Pectobacterium atrosepticum]|uniref:hypothetical protein n=1 Tax=Pectobacterium atrosepticum TaxID=29471 RepID=UPI00039C86AD|nr:hypothetical protein [Pectobacterium atrosepticum]MCL6408542.1 hypothetical protein [Dickeya dadantii]GKV83756.1 hypothetical protein PEC301296_00680 [Pectobacterium carotovorum subsp. carotovorum]AIK14199.1 hypothetical protein GZ59_24020 [Pectobacterium atrosepticum]ATY91010.1 hypothetical protein CVS35_11935 [Pectobacterium atrosepticum]MBL0894440.1 hypothetical protein [Pectobacterium atrosepticum]
MIGLNLVSPVSYYATPDKLDYVQGISRSSQLSGYPNQDASTRTRTAYENSGSVFKAPIADGVNRPTATNQLNVYV